MDHLDPCSHRRAAPDLPPPLSPEVVRHILKKHLETCSDAVLFRSWCPCIPPVTLAVACFSCTEIVLVATLDDGRCEHSARLLEPGP